MKKIWKADNPAEFARVLKAGADRHIPISESALTQWENEANTVFSGTSYGENLKRDVKMARECNARQDELTFTV